MLLRCSGCGDLVSEWAARCPLCSQDTQDAELLPEPLRIETGEIGEIGETGETGETGEMGRVVRTLGSGVPDIFTSGYISSAGIIPVAMSRPMVPFGGQAPRASPTFARMVPLNRSDVACALGIWWAGDTATSELRLQHRLELGPPRVIRRSAGPSRAASGDSRPCTGSRSSSSCGPCTTTSSR